ncbi:MAG: hypothetical protein ACJ8AI_17360 [Rhodopila sp.]
MGLDKGYRFIATEMKPGDLDGPIFPIVAEIQRLGYRIYPGSHITAASCIY